MIPYILFIVLTLLNSFQYLSSYFYLEQSNAKWFFKSLSIQPNQHRDRLISNMSCVLCHLNLCLVFLHLCILDSFSNPWSKLIHYQTLLVHAKQAIIETNPKSSTHVSFNICQICLLSHDTMIFLNIEAISSTPFALLSFSWTILFPWSSNTTIHNLAFIWTLCGIPSSLLSCWTFDTLSKLC